MSEAAGEFTDAPIEGRYHILGKIAEGGMATIYRATDERLARTVAIKVIHTQLAQGPHRAQFIARFHREATSAAAIANPHIVQVYDTGESDGLDYLVMEYVHGVNLRHDMVMRHTFDVKETLRILSETLDGLASAHAAGVIHRDIKPENILINDRGHVQITDFGLAKAASQATLTTTGMLLGTAAYLSPETIERNESSPRSDLYSLGIVVWEMLAGEVPFASANAVSLVFKHVHDDIPSLAEACPGIDPGLSTYVARLTARNPAQRPADASQALEELQHLTELLSPEALQYRKPTAERDDDESAGPRGSMSRHTTALPLVPPPPANSPRSADPRSAGSRTASSRDAAKSPAGTATTEIIETGITRQNSDNVTSAGDMNPAAEAAPSEAAQPQADRDAHSSGPRKRHRATWITGIIVLLVALAGGGFTWWYYLGPGSYWSMPNASGLACEENRPCVITDVSWQSYEGILRQAGIPYTAKQEFSDTVENGNIISTTPSTVGAHISRRHSTKVVVTVSKGVQQATIPTDILDPNSADGKDPVNALKEAGFSTIVHDTSKDQYSQTLAEGVAVSVSPDPGTTLAHNETITLQVSKGPMPVSMPDVIGRSKSDAQAAFDDAKLKASYTESYSDSVAKGSVISTSVKAGTQMHWGDSVDVVVSKGPETVTMPDVTGKNKSDAQQVLEQLGFQVKISAPLGDITHTVRLQSVKAGEQVRIHDDQGNATVVTLTVV